MDKIFLDHLIRIVGADAVSVEQASCDLLARTTLPYGTRPVGVVRPMNREQVQQILQKANEFKIPLYPISGGKNWGYGNACAPQEGMLILDFSRMNRIVEVNTELAYAVIEPGVTQGQLAEYLKQNQIPLLLDGNGAGPDASLVGNILERGFGHSRYGDRFAHCCNLEAVLADGSVFSTGFGSFPEAKAQHLYRWGVGPVLEGLLTQSNIGIVTRMTIWLMPQPEYVNYVFLGLKEKPAIGSLVDRFRSLYLAGTLRSIIHCANDRRLLASATHYPWDQADGRQALEKDKPELIQNMYRQFGVRAWSMAGILTGSPAEVAAARKAVRRALRGMTGIDTFFFMGPRLFFWSQRVAAWLKRFGLLASLQRDLEKVRWLVNLFEGQPSYETLAGAHWRSRGKAGDHQDPLDSRAGLIWINCVLPMTSSAVLEVNSIAEPIFQTFGFEFQTTLSFINERAICAIMSVCFDHASDHETARARECEGALLSALLEKGYVPYRLSAAQQKLVLSKMRAGDAAGLIKKAMDPDDIVAPGRYRPS